MQLYITLCIYKIAPTTTEALAAIVEASSAAALNVLSSEGFKLLKLIASRSFFLILDSVILFIEVWMLVSRGTVLK
jgi:hypothetical protein